MARESIQSLRLNKIEEALQASSAGWHENANSYEPFLKYYLGILLKAYNEFESRVEHLKTRTLSKPERIRTIIDQKVGKITKKEIMEAALPVPEYTTVEFMVFATLRNHKWVENQQNLRGKEQDTPQDTPKSINFL